MKLPFEMMTWLWAAGCAVALASFAVKVGLGFAAELFDESAPAWRRWGFVAAGCVVYVLLFLTVPLADRWSNETAWNNVLLGVVRSGMAVHAAVGIGLLGWGLTLLSSAAQGHTGGQSPGKSRGHWFLVLPCPVCMTVVLGAGLTGTRLLAIPAAAAALLLSALFLGLVMASVLTVLPFRRRIAAHRRAFLGGVMTVGGMFIFLMLLVASVYLEAREVFALALQEKESASAGRAPLVAWGAGAAVLFALGAIRQWQILKGDRVCKW